MDKELVYRNLKKLESQKNFTQAQISKGVGKSRQWYQDIFKIKNIRLDDLIALADFFKVSIFYLFENHDIENSTKEYTTNDSKPLVTESSFEVDKMKNKIQQLTLMNDAYILLVEKQASEIKTLERVLKRSNKTIITDKVEKLKDS